MFCMFLQHFIFPQTFSEGTRGSSVVNYILAILSLSLFPYRVFESSLAILYPYTPQIQWKFYCSKGASQFCHHHEHSFWFGLKAVIQIQALISKCPQWIWPHVMRVPQVHSRWWTFGNRSTELREFFIWLCVWFPRLGWLYWWSRNRNE